MKNFVSGGWAIKRLDEQGQELKMWRVLQMAGIRQGYASDVEKKI